MNCPMTQTTLAPNLVVYASMTNQSPENNLTPRNKVTLTRTGILDCRGKPLLQKLEQNTLNDIKKEFLPKENTQNVTLRGENLPKGLLDKTSSGNVEKLFGYF